MKFTDYKCLESLLIEGEEMIATEGIGSVISGIAKKIFGMFTGFINTIIGIFRGMINKLRGKKPKKFSHEELKKMGIDSFEPDTIKIDKVKVDKIKVDTFKPESNVSSNTCLKNGERFGVTSETAMSILRSLVHSICTNYLKVFTNMGNTDISDEVVTGLNNEYKKASEKLDEYISKYTNSHNVITNKYKEFIIKGLDENIARLEQYKNRIDKFKNEEVNNLKANEKECINLVIKLIPKAQNYATKMTAIINNCEISE